jgi:hypothetical protein
MSKARVIGACSAGSTIYHCNVNLNTAGGNKKQGLPFQLDRRTFQHRTVKRIATGDKRDYIFTMNQIGGIGRVAWYPRDGIRPRAPYKYGSINKMKTTGTVLTCDAVFEGPDSNIHSYVVDDIRYVIIPEVSCDPFKISILNINAFDTSLSFTNLTYIPNGPTNGYTGYVFQTNITNIPIDFDVHATNFNCSTMDVNTLVIQPNGSTQIQVLTDSININGSVCDNITTIIYNGTTYQTTIYNYNYFGSSFYIQGLEETSFNASIQCI